jgi:hypothetical protein
MVTTSPWYPRLRTSLALGRRRIRRTRLQRRQIPHGARRDVIRAAGHQPGLQARHDRHALRVRERAGQPPLRPARVRCDLPWHDKAPYGVLPCPLNEIANLAAARSLKQFLERRLRRSWLRNRKFLSRTPQEPLNPRRSAQPPAEHLCHATTGRSGQAGRPEAVAATSSARHMVKPRELCDGSHGKT